MTIVILIAVCVRVGWVCARYAGGGRADDLQYPDEQAYLTVAESLAAGSGMVDEFGYRATYMPAYPAWLALWVRSGLSLLAVRLGQAFSGALLVWAVWRIARSWTGDLRVAVLASMATALDPFLIFFSGLLLTETFFAATLALAWVYVSRLCQSERNICVGDVLWAGVWLWAGIMLRPAAVVLLPTAVVLIPVARGLRRSGWVAATTIGAIVLMGLLPWAARNHVVLGEWCWLTTRGGISLYDGLQPGGTGASDLAHTKTLPEIQGLDEVAWNTYFQRQAIQQMRENPVRVLRLAVAKFRRTWSLVPNAATEGSAIKNLISLGWMSLALAALTTGLWIKRRAVRFCLVLLAPAMAVTVLHMVFVGSVRYRIPIMPLLYVVGATGVVGLLDKRDRSRGDAGKTV